MKPCIIKQPAGIGDIFFCQKLAKIMMAHDYSVIWPVREDILWISDYIKDITFVPEHWNFLDQTVFQNAFGAYVGDDMAFISPATADMTHNDGKIMSSKYSMLGLDYRGWQDFFRFERNLEKENLSCIDRCIEAEARNLELGCLEIESLLPTSPSDPWLKGVHSPKHT